MFTMEFFQPRKTINRIQKVGPRATKHWGLPLAFWSQEKFHMGPALWSPAHPKQCSLSALNLRSRLSLL